MINFNPYHETFPIPCFCLPVFLSPQITASYRVTRFQAPQGASRYYSLTCWRPVSLLHGPASARKAELLRSGPLGSAGGKLMDGSPSRLKEVNNEVRVLRKPHRSLKKTSPPCSFTADKGWMRSVVALCLLPARDDSRPVSGGALQFVTFFGGGLNQSII